MNVDLSDAIRVEVEATHFVVSWPGGLKRAADLPTMLHYVGVALNDVLADPPATPERARLRRRAYNDGYDAGYSAASEQLREEIRTAIPWLYESA